MKRIITLLCLFTCIFCLQTHAFAELKPIKITTGEWEPYTSSTMSGYGAFSEIVTATFHEIGMEPHYVFYPWKRAEYDVQKGQAFAAIPYKITDERKQIFDFSDTIMKSTGKFFFYKKFIPNEPKYQEFKDLSSYRIGGVLGYWYEPLFLKEKLTMDYVSTDIQNLKKLYINRVQLIACDELVGWAMITKTYPNETAQFGTLAKPLNQDDLKLMVSRAYPNSAEIVKEFNTALQKLKKNGKLSAILKKYHINE